MLPLRHQQQQQQQETIGEPHARIDRLFHFSPFLIYLSHHRRPSSTVTMYEWRWPRPPPPPLPSPHLKEKQKHQHHRYSATTSLMRQSALASFSPSPPPPSPPPLRVTLNLIWLDNKIVENWRVAISRSVGRSSVLLTLFFLYCYSWVSLSLSLSLSLALFLLFPWCTCAPQAVLNLIWFLFFSFNRFLSPFPNLSVSNSVT